MALLYRSGLRVSEIVALRPADVDLRTHSVRVLHGKGGKATTPGFHPSRDDALAHWIDMRKPSASTSRDLDHLSNTVGIEALKPSSYPRTRRLGAVTC